MYLWTVRTCGLSRSSWLSQAAVSPLFLGASAGTHGRRLWRSGRCDLSSTVRFIVGIAERTAAAKENTHTSETGCFFICANRRTVSHLVDDVMLALGEL